MSATGKYLLIITGPTAVGKTAVAIELADYYQTEIISCDSRQFYRGMDIGTAKPDPEELKRIKHHFIDTKDPDELFGAGHFAEEALKLLDKLYTKHDLVIMAGGSGMYIEALVKGVDEFEEIPIEFRNRLNAEWKEKGIEHLQEKLKMADPEYYEKVDKMNPQRIVRALEVFEYTGKKFSSFLDQTKTERNFTPIYIRLDLPRETLYQRINQRVDKMIEAGLVEEVKKLLPYRNSNALKTVGYKEIIEFMDGHSTLEKAIENIKQHTRNYAKRQLTWFKNKNDAEVFQPDEVEKIKAYLEIIMQHG